MPIVDPTEVAELPPAALLKHMGGLHLDGCRCEWQLKPRTGWVRLNTEPRCPHHDPKWRAEHLEETLRRIVPRDYPVNGAVPPDAAWLAAALSEIHALVWGPG